MKKFGEFLQAELNERNWSYSDLANRSGLHVSLISRVARAKRRPTLNFVQRCATALSLPLCKVLMAAGMLEEAVVAHDTAEAQALQQYIQYAATPEGEEEIADRLPGKLGKVRLVQDATGQVALLLDRLAQLIVRFRQANGAHRALIGGALLYFISPVDLVPDFIPITGLVDDLVVISLVFRMTVAAHLGDEFPGGAPTQ